MDLEKNADRVEGMLFHTCGCSKDEAKIVICEVLKRINMKPEDSERYWAIREKEHKERMKQIEEDIKRILNNKV